MVAFTAQDLEAEPPPPHGPWAQGEAWEGASRG